MPVPIHQDAALFLKNMGQPLTNENVARAVPFLEQNPQYRPSYENAADQHWAEGNREWNNPDEMLAQFEGMDDEVVSERNFVHPMMQQQSQQNQQQSSPQVSSALPNNPPTPPQRPNQPSQSMPGIRPDTPSQVLEPGQPNIEPQAPSSTEYSPSSTVDQMERDESGRSDPIDQFIPMVGPAAAVGAAGAAQSQLPGPQNQRQITGPQDQQRQLVGPAATQDQQRQLPAPQQRQLPAPQDQRSITGTASQRNELAPAGSRSVDDFVDRSNQPIDAEWEELRFIGDQRQPQLSDDPDTPRLTPVDDQSSPAQLGNQGSTAQYFDEGSNDPARPMARFARDVNQERVSSDVIDQFLDEYASRFGVSRQHANTSLDNHLMRLDNNPPSRQPATPEADVPSPRRIPRPPF